MTCKHRQQGPWSHQCLFKGDCSYKELGPYIPTCENVSLTKPATPKLTQLSVIDEMDDDLEDFLADPLYYMLYSDEDEY